MSRDPKSDPRPGDVLRDKWGGIVITERTDGFIYYADAQVPLRVGVCTPEQWREWAKDAEVVEVAGAET